MLLHVREWGERAAPAVVCVHGIGGHGARFRRLAEERLARTHRVVAVDLRGHGRSDWDPPWSLDAHVADLDETLQRLDVARGAWIGHSFGGRVALEVADRLAARVDRLVLLDPAVWAPPPLALERAEAARTDPSFASVEEAIADAAAWNPHSPRGALKEEMREHLVAASDGRLRFRRCASAVVTGMSELAKSPPALRTIRVRTLLVYGLESDVVPDYAVEFLAREMSTVLELVAVPGGHNVLWDAFAETADAIASFLADDGN